jgi:hypothetical protein
MSYWLNRPAAKTSLSQLLDICLAEQFDLVSLIMGHTSVSQFLAAVTQSASHA